MWAHTIPPRSSTRFLQGYGSDMFIVSPPKMLLKLYFSLSKNKTKQNKTQTQIATKLIKAMVVPP